MIKGSKVVVVTKTLKEAKEIALKVKQKASVEPYDGFYQVIIDVKTKRKVIECKDRLRN